MGNSEKITTWTSFIYTSNIKISLGSGKEHWRGAFLVKSAQIRVGLPQVFINLS